jgi:hypothetical protein
MNNKEKIIVLQNQSHLVERWFNNRGIKADLFDISMATDVMSDFVLSGMTKDVIQRFKTMDEYLNKKYNK